jgi:hypothetical protein
LDRITLRGKVDNLDLASIRHVDKHLASSFVDWKLSGESINTSSIGGLRDRALIGVMTPTPSSGLR